MRSITRRRRLRAACATAVLASFPTIGLAGVAFSSGSATWSWRPADNLSKSQFVITPPASGSMPTNPNFQLSKSTTVGSSNAQGKGSIGYITNSTTASFTLAGGSGAAQADPGDVSLPGGTITKVQFSGLFSPTSPSFGPTATGYFQLAVGGNIGPGGSTQVAFDAQFRLNNANGPLLRSAISGGDTFFGNVTPSFSKVYTYSTAMSPSTIGLSNQIFVSGSVTFIASNHGGPTDVFPIALEAGGAPPTATFYAPGGFFYAWTDETAWSPPDNPAAGIFAFTEPGALIPIIPNAPGHRARFINNTVEPRNLELDTDITLGSLHIDSRSSVRVLSDASMTTQLTMDVLGVGESASIFVGGSFGDQEHSIDANTVLADDLEVRVEAFEPGPNNGSTMAFNGSILKQTATPRNLTVRGDGQVDLNAPNSHDGTTRVTDGGQLNANAPGALGAGPVVVDEGSVLVINAPNPSTSGQPMQAGNFGNIRINTPVVGSMNFLINEGGAISGDGPVLQQLVVGTNLTLVPSAIIGHLQFDTDPSVGNPIGLGTTPLYIFGIATDFDDLNVGSIVVGSASNSPWIGFGNDGEDRIYGNSPTIPGTAAVTIAGNGHLVASARSLTLNAPLLGGVTSVANILGGGVVALDSTTSPFAGQIFISPEATLRVNGALPAVQSVSVETNGRLGGDGTIGGAVIVQFGGILDPGAEKSFEDITGVLTTGPMTLLTGAVLDFDFGSEGILNDLVHVQGDLVLNGLLRINQLQEFEGPETFTFMTYTGQVTNNGIAIDPFSQEIFGLPAVQAASIQIIPNPTGPGGSVVLVIPEPGCIAFWTLAGMGILRRRRG